MSNVAADKARAAGLTNLVCLALCALIVVTLSAPPIRVAAQTQDVVLVGAGDIGQCGPGNLANALATATLIDAIPGTVFAAGDLGYPTGTDGDFAKCYAASWGRHRARTLPVPGEHDDVVPNAMGYFNYWGAAAGTPTKSYYSLNYGAWHIVVLNSECNNIRVGGCTAGSPQGQWLEADLAAHPAACTLALWHRPLYTSTKSHVTTAVSPLWQILYNAKADLVVNGSSHNYERFAPQNANGNLDTTNGLVEFVVGTGGAPLASFTTTAANSQVRNSSTYGVLKLTLHATSYDWQFVPIAGQTFTDSGTQACH